MDANHNMGKPKIFFLFISNNLKLQQAKTFGCKRKKKSWLFPTIFSWLASKIIDVRNQTTIVIANGDNKSFMYVQESDVKTNSFV